MKADELIALPEVRERLRPTVEPEGKKLRRQFRRQLWRLTLFLCERSRLLDVLTRHGIPDAVGELYPRHEEKKHGPDDDDD